MEQKEICETLKDHGTRIGRLEVKDAEQSVKIDNLVDSLKNLTGWIKALVLSMFGALIGFGVWIIQYLITK